MAEDIITAKSQKQPHPRFPEQGQGQEDAQTQRASTAPAWLKIDLGAIADNQQTIRKQLGPHTEIAGIVKANGYGMGAEKVAETLYDCGSRRFFVATLDEALNLRAHLPEDTMIATLCGLLPNADSYYREQNITPVLNTRPVAKVCWIHRVSLM